MKNFIRLKKQKSFVFFYILYGLFKQKKAILGGHQVD